MPHLMSSSEDTGDKKSSFILWAVVKDPPSGLGFGHVYLLFCRIMQKLLDEFRWNLVGGWRRYVLFRVLFKKISFYIFCYISMTCPFTGMAVGCRVDYTGRQRIGKTRNGVKSERGQRKQGRSESSTHKFMASVTFALSHYILIFMLPSFLWSLACDPETNPPSQWKFWSLKGSSEEPGSRVRTHHKVELDVNRVTDRQGCCESSFTVVWLTWDVFLWHKKKQRHYFLLHKLKTLSDFSC